MIGVKKNFYSVEFYLQDHFLVAVSLRATGGETVPERTKGQRVNGAMDLTVSQREYLATIFDLENARRKARAKDIAERMGVLRGSVTGAMKALAGKGLVHYRPYREISLTPAGTALARDIARRHRVLRSFLGKVLQMVDREAEANARRMERAMDETAVERLVRFIEYIDHCPRTGPQWVNAFVAYCSAGKPAPETCIACLATCRARIGRPPPTPTRRLEYGRPQKGLTNNVGKRKIFWLAVDGLGKILFSGARAASGVSLLQGVPMPLRTCVLPPGPIFCRRAQTGLFRSKPPKPGSNRCSGNHPRTATGSTIAPISLPETWRPETATGSTKFPILFRSGVPPIFPGPGPKKKLKTPPPSACPLHPRSPLPRAWNHPTPSIGPFRPCPAP